ncbi:hypothetical protein HRI_002905800 [Hibiscus trionum]|uniref:Uncharacterized protein n=1 Tax=Hibiscus trionum TaxID=183268 RepID=A0A9W7IDC5_HIBTR|nr:hypothetical protein HRI_002905800 [Hibiscus trionum]
MQAAAIVAMAAHAILTITPSPHTLLPPLSTNPSDPQVVQSTFPGANPFPLMSLPPSRNFPCLLYPRKLSRFLKVIPKLKALSP